HAHQATHRRIVEAAFETDAAKRCIAEIDSDSEVKYVSAASPVTDDVRQLLAHSECGQCSLRRRTFAWQWIVEKHGQSALGKLADGALERVGGRAQCLIDLIQHLHDRFGLR